MENNTPKKIRYDKLGVQVAAALNRRHFEACYCPTVEEAVEKVFSFIPAGASIGWGGSMTVSGMHIQKIARERGYALVDREQAKTPEERHELMRRCLLADTFLMSSNAISEDGVLVNLDGTGNRVAAMAYGPRQVIVIAGMNKVVKSEADAISRCRNIAAPANAQRFPVHTPCKETGACANCTSGDCICNYLLVTRNSSPAGKIKVILVGEELGL